MNHTLGRFWWQTIGGVLAVAMFGWGTFNLTTLLAHGQEHQVHHYDAGDVRRLVVDSATGSITVTAAEVDTVTVAADITTSIGRTTHTATLRHGTLEVHAGCPWYSTWCSVDYTVTAPASVALGLDTGNGSIEVRGTDASVTVHSGNGHVVLTDVAGPVRASSGNGWLEGRGLHSTDVNASTGNGHLDLDFAVPVHRVRARTGNGSAEVHVPDLPGAYRVDASTGHGSRTVAVRTDPAGADLIDVDTGNGHLRVDYRSP